MGFLRSPTGFNYYIALSGGLPASPTMSPQNVQSLLIAYHNDDHPDFKLPSNPQEYYIPRDGSECLTGNLQFETEGETTQVNFKTDKYDNGNFFISYDTTHAEAGSFALKSRDGNIKLFASDGAGYPTLTADFGLNDSTIYSPLTLEDDLDVDGDAIIEGDLTLGNDSLLSIGYDTSWSSGYRMNIAPSSNLREWIISSASGADFNLLLENTSSGDFNFQVAGKVTAKRFRINNCPTSSSGLSSGDIYSDNGTLKIVA